MFLVTKVFLVRKKKRSQQRTLGVSYRQRRLGKNVFQSMSD